MNLSCQSKFEKRERDANKAVNEICGPEWQTGKYDVYIHIYRIMKNPDLVCIRLYVAPKYKMFFPVSNNIQQETEGERECSSWWEKWEKFEDLTEKKVTLRLFMYTNMATPEKCNHLRLAYHFTLPLMIFKEDMMGLKN